MGVSSNPLCAMQMQLLNVFPASAHVRISMKENKCALCTQVVIYQSKTGCVMSLCSSATDPAETVIQSRCVVLYPLPSIRQTVASGRLNVYKYVCAQSHYNT